MPWNFANIFVQDSDLFVQFGYFAFLDILMAFGPVFLSLNVALSSIVTSIPWIKINLREQDVCSITFDRLRTETTCESWL